MRRALLAAGLAALLAPSAALAHVGNPNMTTTVRSVRPAVPGVQVQVLDRGGELELRNRSHREILVYGYGAPGRRDVYARMLASGVVQENRNSPAYYLNQDYYGDVTVPAHAKVGAAPDWVTVSNDGRLQWHDHRAHFMGTGTPPGIRDTSKRQRWEDYAVPIVVGGTAGAIRGTIWWAPIRQSGPPVAAIVALVLVALAGLAAVIVVRRRRARRPGASPPREEAW